MQKAQVHQTLAPYNNKYLTHTAAVQRACMDEAHKQNSRYDESNQ